MKINVKILVSGSWMKCVGFMRHGKRFISAEIYLLVTNKNKNKKKSGKITARF